MTNEWLIGGNDASPDHPEYMLVCLANAKRGQRITQEEYDDLRARLGMTIDPRIARALAYAMDGGTDAAHHLRWVVDQMVRALTDCPTVEDSAIDANGLPYTYERQGESELYLKWVAQRCEGGYAWDEGIAP